MTHKHSNIHIFTDGSVNTKSKLGYGAILVLSDDNMANQTIDRIRPNIKTAVFDNTSSTRLELQTLIFALNGLDENTHKNHTITAYTDSQNIVGLPKRRERLEQSNFYSAKGKRLNHWDLYREFYHLIDHLEVSLIKVEGHKSSSQRNRIEQIFSLVDQHARYQLRRDKTDSGGKQIV